MSGPLDELFGALASTHDALPLEPVHVRALEQDADDHTAWVLAVWSDPGGPVALHRALRQRVEATMLAELSRTAAELRATGSRRFDALRLAVFPELDAAEAVRAFGLAPARPDAPAWRHALAHLRHEAQLVGATVDDEPASVWEAHIAHRSSNDALEDALRASGGDEVWGQAPGGPAARLARAVREAGLGDVGPDVEGLRALEAIVLQREPGPIRFIPPLVFQALCDQVALAAQHAGAQVQWAECAPSEDGGHAPPPLVRMRQGGAWAHVPLGLELLRWCVMPIQPGEEVPLLADWVTHTFAPK